MKKLILAITLFALVSCATQLGRKSTWHDYDFKIGTSHLSVSFPKGQSMSVPTTKLAEKVIALPISPDNQSKLLFSGWWDFGAKVWKQPECTLRIKLTLQSSGFVDISTLLRLKNHLNSKFEKHYYDQNEWHWQSYNNPNYTYTNKLSREEFMANRGAFKPVELLGYNFNDNIWLASKTQMNFYTTIDANHFFKIFVDDFCQIIDEKSKTEMNRMTERILDSIYLTDNLKLK